MSLVAEQSDLFGAISREFNRHTGDADPHTLCGGRIYDTLAPPGTDEPYVVVTVVPGPFARMFGSNTLESQRIQIAVYDLFDGNTRIAWRIWEGIVRILEDVTLSTGSGTFLRFARMATPSCTNDGKMVEVSGDWLVECQFDRSRA